MAEAAVGAEDPEPLVTALVWGIRHSVREVSFIGSDETPHRPHRPQIKTLTLTRTIILDWIHRVHANYGAGAVRREQNIENLWTVRMVRPVRCFVGPGLTVYFLGTELEKKLIKNLYRTA